MTIVTKAVLWREKQRAAKLLFLKLTVKQIKKERKRGGGGGGRRKKRKEEKKKKRKKKGKWRGR